MTAVPPLFSHYDSQ